jgi:Protein of unknown function (DUF4241)
MVNIKYPDFLESAFTLGYTNTVDEDLYTFHTISLGLLNSKDGRLIACDPFVLEDELAFTAVFPTGQFPVELAIADIETDERVGFARIKFSDAAPVSWEYALLPEQDTKTLEPGDIFGFAVDSGTAAFMDSTGYDVLSKQMDTEEDYDEVLIEMMDEHYKHTHASLLWQSGEANVAMFSSGWGDGIYQCYIGFDAENNICRLVADFGLLDWPE